MGICYVSDKKSIKDIVDLIVKGYLIVGNDLIKELENTEEEKTVNYKPCMESQRKYCWEKWRVGNLIQSLLMFDDSIPELTVYRHDDRSQFRKVLDGQQRLTSIYYFITNRIQLDMSRSIYRTFTIESNDYSADFMNWKTFSELPQLWQDIILGKSLRWMCVNNCDEETAEKLFVQLNSNVKLLRPAEVRRAGMGSEMRHFLSEIKEADWWLHALTPVSLYGNQGDEILSHIITILDNNIEPTSLKRDDVNNVIYKYRKTNLPENIQNELQKVNFYLNDITKIWIDEKKEQDEIDSKGKGRGKSNYNTYRFKFLNKTNTVMFMIAASIAMHHNIKEKYFAEWAYSFFRTQSIEYREACAIDCEKKKASDKECVGDRIRLIYASLTSKFGTVIITKKEDQLEQEEQKETEQLTQNDSIYPNTDFLYAKEEINTMMSEFSDPFGEELNEAV